MALPCLILAGGKAKPEVQALLGVTTRALAVVNGKTMLEHVVVAVSGSAGVGPILVTGNVPNDDRYETLPDAGGFVDNVFAGLSRFADDPFVLIVTSDLPFLTAPAVDEFVRGATAVAASSGAGFIWPVVPVAACIARFPDVRRTSVRLREGAFTGGNLALVRPEMLLANRERIAAAYAARKSPLRLAVILGPGMLLRLAISQILSPRALTIGHLEQRISRLMNGPARALVSDAPEIATDLDRPGDFAACGLISQSAPGPP